MSDQCMGHDHASAAPQTPAGLSIAASGYMLARVSAPTAVGRPGRLSFQIQDASGAPLVSYAPAHGRQLHLIVVRSDGTRFRHGHPTLDPAAGTWSLPWTWDAAGTYRIFADFTPAGGGGTANVTLTSMVDVAGEFLPSPAAATRTTDEAGGFTVTVDGDLTAGSVGELTVEVTRDGRPVTALQPYLGAFGHLVALRAGDLAYLHVHVQGDEPAPGDTAGPTLTFGAQAPTAGTYLLYLDFQVDEQVHTAEFVLTATHPDAAAHPGTHTP